MAGALSFTYTAGSAPSRLVPRWPPDMGDTHAQGDRMPRYVVTGGPDGNAGINIGDDRYEPGDHVDATAKTVKWLVDDGYLEPVGKPAPVTADEE